MKKCPSMGFEPSMSGLQLDAVTTDLLLASGQQISFGLNNWA